MTGRGDIKESSQGRILAPHRPAEHCAQGMLHQLMESTSQPLDMVGAAAGDNGLPAVAENQRRGFEPGFEDGAGDLGAKPT